MQAGARPERRRHGEGHRVAAEPEQQDAACKREGNETAEGRIGVFIDNAAKVAAIVEMRCESAPSAKSDQFVALANDLAKHVALKNPTTVAEAADASRSSAAPATFRTGSTTSSA